MAITICAPAARAKSAHGSTVTLGKMNSYRERLESAGQLAAFERAQRAGDRDAMGQLLKDARFSDPEIESILWARGDITPVGPPEEKLSFWNAVTARLSIALVSGLVLGGVFAYASSGLDRSERTGESQMDIAMRDYRSPKEAYYRPFLWGFAIGAIGGLVTGTLVYDPTSKRA